MKASKWKIIKMQREGKFSKGEYKHFKKGTDREARVFNVQSDT